MDPTVIAALIGALGTLLAPVVTLLIFERRHFLGIPLERREALTGSWKGLVNQYVGPGPSGEPIIFPILIKFTLGKKVVRGQATYTWEEESRDILINGGFIDDRYIKFEYKDADPRIIRYGMGMFELSADGHTLLGKLIGYSAEMHSMVHCDLNLEKSLRFGT